MLPAATSNAPVQRKLELEAEATPERTRPTAYELFRGVQRKAAMVEPEAAPIHAIAQRGIATPTSALPHAERIQRAFGRHDISGIRAHVGADAAASALEMNARAYATGDHVVFNGAPDLHTAAHETAHVVQQRAGVHLQRGVGSPGDIYERHADAVADRVVQGESAEELLDVHTGGGGGSGVAVQHRVEIDTPETAAKSHERTVRKVRSLLHESVGSTELNQVLAFLTNSPTAHLHVELKVIDGEDKEHTGKSGGKLEGQTGIYLGDGDLQRSEMLQEALLVDPTPLLDAKCSLTIGVRIFLRADLEPHELATTILHELELHAVPAGRLLRRLDIVRHTTGNDPDTVIGSLLQYLAAPDQHTNIDRAIAFVKTAGRLYDACRGSDWEGWAKATRNTICWDAETQFLAAAHSNLDLDRLEYLQGVVASVKGEAPADAGELPEKLAPRSSYRTVKTAKRTLDKVQVLEHFARGVRERHTMESMIEELGEKFGVPRAESIALYNREIAPLVYAEAPTKENSDLLFLFMSSYGVPPPVTQSLVEQDNKNNAGEESKQRDKSQSSKGRKPGFSSWLLSPPKERAFFTDPVTESDWTPITNYYVPRSVLAAHAELHPEAQITVDGYKMRVKYTKSGDISGASHVKGSKYTPYMVLCLPLAGG